MSALKWWQRAVFYQIYPRSFADGDGDGIGDFPGMIQKLDYLRELGVDAIWLSPHFPSPQADCGYDISDYTGVAPEYGTLEDFRTFLREAHARGIRVVLDLVLNHSSDQHPWFLESRAGRDSPKRDWYIWRDGRDGGPPNNWESAFGDSAWAYDEQTGQYYYHHFLEEQPDLNWRNPAVKQAMWEAVRFWLDMGVDGFRLDAVGTIFERPDLPDHSSPKGVVALQSARQIVAGPLEATVYSDWRRLFAHQVDQPGIHELMRELRAVVDGYEDRVLVGESDEVAYHGSGDDELHMVFNFPLMQPPRLTPAWVRANQAQRLAELATVAPHVWPCNTLGNHDSPRVKDRYGDGAHDDELARVHLALLLTLRGTPFLYNGEEIGMTGLALGDIAQFRDLWGIWNYHMVRDRLGGSEEAALRRAAATTRDGFRTPHQWANAPNAGFSPAGVTTWLPVNPNYAQGVNVADQEGDPASLLGFYRRLIHLRRATPALVAGDYQALDPDSDAYLAFLRHDVAGGQTCLVALNFTPEAQTIACDLPGRQARLLFSSEERGETPLALDSLALAPFEALIAELI